MKCTNVIVFFSLVKIFVNFVLNSPFFSLSFHLSYAYTGHSKRKCCGVSFGALQAGHCRLSFLLKQCKYAFSGMCPDHSWKILLVSTLEIFVLLISLIFLRRREGPICLNLV
jgi:hypothetical protein